ncbi:MAG: response regulator [Phycisphaerae bacterium]|nr:response regulator [Phycisphaerae bacterium]
MSNTGGTSRNGVRVDPELVESTLDQLDRDTDAGAGGDHGRKEERFRYRVRELHLELAEPGGGFRGYQCPTRNISSHGLALLMSHFVYPGTACRVTLVSLHNHRATHTGKVVRCRYLPGTARLHDCGIIFDQPINVGLFHRGAQPTRILVADDEKAQHKLIESMLKSEKNTKVVAVSDGEAALEKLRNEQFDIALIDINMPKMDGLAVAQACREAAIGTPLAAFTADSAPDSRTKCMQAGFDTWLAKPLTSGSLTTLIRSLKSEPLISSLIHDRNLLDVIDTFVDAVQARIEDMQTALGESDWPLMQRQLRSLSIDASGAGFDSIAMAADELLGVLGDQPDLASVRAKLSGVVRLCGSAMSASCQPAGGRK